MLPRFQIGIFIFESYRTCAIVAMLFSCFAALLCLRRANAKNSIVLLALLAMSILLGARLFHFCMHPEIYGRTLHLWSLEYRGLALYGGFIGAVITLKLWCSIRGEDFWKLADVLTIPCAIAIIILKLGCFLNGCCGGHITNSILGVVFPGKQEETKMIQAIPLFGQLYPEKIAVYPSQLFEVVAAILGLGIFLIGKRFKLPKGVTCLSYAAWFTLSRFLLHGLRDFGSNYSVFVIDIFYPALYLVLLFVFILLIVFRYRKSKQEEINNL